MVGSLPSCHSERSEESRPERVARTTGFVVRGFFFMASEIVVGCTATIHLFSALTTQFRVLNYIPSLGSE